MNQQTQNPGAVTTRDDNNAAAEPIILRKRIGSVTFEVAVQYSATSRETMTDKLLRLMEREVKKSA
jgi:hypothetical protein